MSSYDSRSLQLALRDFQWHVHQTAKEKGWWDEERPTGVAIALMHNELSEALEVLRKDPEAMDKHCPDCKAVAVEFADVIIRILDTCEKNGWDVAGALVDKARYNESRPHKHGGKAF